MKLMGKDISGESLLQELRSVLAVRGLAEPEAGPIRFDGLEPKVDPLAFNLEAMSEHADPTRALPLESHRTGLSRAVVLAKRLFRATGQVFINEALGRQKRFNGHVRDSYAQLSAEVIGLRQRLAALEAAQAKPTAVATGRISKPTKRKGK